MKKRSLIAAAIVSVLALTMPVMAEDVTLTVAMVNNDPFVVLEELSSQFTEDTGIKLDFQVLSENEVRAKIQEDVAMGGGNYDLVTLGTSDMATYLMSGWTQNLDDLFAGLDEETAAWYDRDDIFPGVLDSNKDAASGALAALPFYSESTMICYRTDV